MQGFSRNANGVWKVGTQGVALAGYDPASVFSMAGSVLWEGNMLSLLGASTTAYGRRQLEL